MTGDPQAEQINPEREQTKAQPQDPNPPSRLSLAIARNLPLGCSLLLNLLLCVCMCLTLSWVVGFWIAPSIFKARPNATALAEAQTNTTPTSSRSRFTRTPVETSSAEATSIEATAETPTSEATPEATLTQGTDLPGLPTPTQTAQSTPRPLNQLYKTGDLAQIMLTQDTLTSLTQPKQWDPVLIDENVLENWSTDDNFNSVVGGWLLENLFNSYVQTDNRCDPPFCQVNYGGLTFDTPEHTQQAYNLWTSNLSKTLQTPIKSSLVSQDYVGTSIVGYDPNNDLSVTNYAGVRGNLLLFVSVSYQGKTAPAAMKPSSLVLFNTMINQSKTIQ